MKRALHVPPIQYLMGRGRERLGDLCRWELFSWFRLRFSVVFSLCCSSKFQRSELLRTCPLVVCEGKWRQKQVKQTPTQKHKHQSMTSATKNSRTRPTSSSHHHSYSSSRRSESILVRAVVLLYCGGQDDSHSNRINHSTHAPQKYGPCS